MRISNLSLGKCLHTINNNPDNHLYVIDYAADGTCFATGGRDTHERLYDESTKSLLSTMRAGQHMPGHSNRVFSVHFDPEDKTRIVSGGWDNTLLVYDTRVGEPVANAYGPHICGDSIDVRGNLVLTGSYRSQEALQLWDLRKLNVVHNIEWEVGGRGSDSSCLYGAQFSKTDAGCIVAGGTAKSEVRVFENDMRAGCPVVGKVSDLEHSCLAVDFGNTRDRFACGTADGLLRIYEVKKE